MTTSEASVPHHNLSDFINLILLWLLWVRMSVRDLIAKRSDRLGLTLRLIISHHGLSSVHCTRDARLSNSSLSDGGGETLLAEDQSNLNPRKSIGECLINSQALASQAQSQLNRLRFLGKVLSVEIAGKPSTNSNNSNTPTTFMKDAPLNLSGGSGPGAEPIAPRLGVDYPFPPHLEYAYPPPDGNILTNIVNALIAVPRFYTQVLHLMNKMNIPAPFRMALPTPPLPVSIPAPPPPPPSPPIAPIANPSLDLSSDESELESSEEDYGYNVDKRNSTHGAPDIMKHKRKRAKKEAIVGPAIDKDVAHEAVGLKPATLVPKEIPLIKKKNPVLQIKITSKPTQKQHDGEESHEKEEEEPLKEGLEVKPFATPEEIERGKLPPEELLSLPMFKNYAAGNPSTVLYIKNLSKDVVADDFFFIFGSVFASVDAAKSCLNVKLMQEGRMRGQAFVTFPSIELAHRALNLVNGYVFKGKPMIIQFGRKPVSGNAN
ncbi:hypothetical protein Syun_002775 [Stephania yunnanensis]|uniref:RRM domain-containing protein n=1 Tax=Stephania yunnanensis TaxID=152371 RepID=A0AAP0Q7R3_9MAGN